MSETDSRAEFMRKLNVMLVGRNHWFNWSKATQGRKSIALLQLANRRISEIEKNLENESELSVLEYRPVEDDLGYD